MDEADLLNASHTATRDISLYSWLMQWAEVAQTFDKAYMIQSYFFHQKWLCEQSYSTFILSCCDLQSVLLLLLI